MIETVDTITVQRNAFLQKLHCFMKAMNGERTTIIPPTMQPSQRGGNRTPNPAQVPKMASPTSSQNQKPAGVQLVELHLGHDLGFFTVGLPFGFGVFQFMAGGPFHGLDEIGL